MNKTSPGRHYKRSSIILIIGVGLLVAAFIAARIAEVPNGDLFAGLLSGAGALGALMAAFEAADAAESSAAAAAQANELTSKANELTARANELTARQFTPSLVVTVEEFHFQEPTDRGPQHIARLYRVAIDNVGSAYTAARQINLFVYINGKKSYRYGKPGRLPCFAASGVTHDLPIAHLQNSKLAEIEGYGVEVFTIHGTVHNAIGWVLEDKVSLFTQQLGDQPLPGKLPEVPAEAYENQPSL